MRHWTKKYIFTAVAAVFAACLFLSACLGSAAGSAGTVTEVYRSGPDQKITSFVIQKEDDSRSGMLMTDETSVKRESDDRMGIEGLSQNMAVTVIYDAESVKTTEDSEGNSIDWYNVREVRINE